MSNREVMQQALEALLWADAQGENWQQVVKKAIKPIQEAAAQPEPVQEPFGYLWPTGSHPEFRFTQQKRDGADGMPLYTAPPQQQAEPVAWTLTETLNKRETTTRGYLWFSNPQNYSWTPLYTAPPQRKPLTCLWSPEDDDTMPSTYRSACGELWSFIDGGWKDNRVKFCHGCGGKVVEASSVTQEPKP